jgi:hypothetical protein
MFFSEEKNQKTFISWRCPPIRPCPATGGCVEFKSLLLLFFRKEDLSSSPRGAPMPPVGLTLYLPSPRRLVAHQ